MENHDGEIVAGSGKEECETATAADAGCYKVVSDNFKIIFNSIYIYNICVYI